MSDCVLFLSSDHRNSQGAKGALAPLKFLENIVILCFERRFSKQNSVIRLKSNISPPPISGLAMPLWKSAQYLPPNPAALTETHQEVLTHRYPQALKILYFTKGKLLSVLTTRRLNSSIKSPMILLYSSFDSTSLCSESEGV